MLEIAHNDLRGVDLERKPYRPYRADWDHDHCAACSAKLMEPGTAVEGVQHEGYATTASYVRGAEYQWVCVECFELFASEMGWRDVTVKH
jgi:hypothetical protein